MTLSQLLAHKGRRVKISYGPGLSISGVLVDANEDTDDLVMRMNGRECTLNLELDKIQDVQQTGGKIHILPH